MNQSAVIFDLDGTITKPNLDFDAVRSEIGIQGPILEAMADMDPVARRRAEEVLLRHEREAAEDATLQDQAVEVIDACRKAGYSVAILTRNARPAVQIVLDKFAIRVDALRTREDGAIKPSPEPILALCEELGVNPTQSWMVGDFLFDIQSGRAAGARTVLMIGDQALPAFSDQADFVIRKLSQLLPLLEG